MDLIRVFIDNECNLSLSIHWIVLAIIISGVIIWVIYTVSKPQLLKNVEIDSAELGISGQKIKIKPNHTNIDVAYKIWVELNTRKIALPIDLQYDVIVEIYDSWYKFFGETRELLKNLPATKIRNDKDTKELIELSTKILNEGLRPHLTRWQAIFRKWYNNQLKDDTKTPQQIQREFPDYQELTGNMIDINSHLIVYKEAIRKLAFGDI